MAIVTCDDEIEREREMWKGFHIPQHPPEERLEKGDKFRLASQPMNSRNPTGYSSAGRNAISFTSALRRGFRNFSIPSGGSDLTSYLACPDTKFTVIPRWCTRVTGGALSPSFSPPSLSQRESSDSCGFFHSTDERRRRARGPFGFSSLLRARLAIYATRYLGKPRRETRNRTCTGSRMQQGCSLSFDGSFDRKGARERKERGEYSLGGLSDGERLARGFTVNSARYTAGGRVFTEKEARVMPSFSRETLRVPVRARLSLQASGD